MTIPETCPHCGAKYAKDGKFSCESEWISGRVFQSQFCKLNQAAKELLENPYPFDLMKIRQEVDYLNSHGVNEKEASEEMEAYCTAEYCEDQLAKHKEAFRKLKEATL